MNEKELMSQLHSLREIQPDSQWKTGNRDILFSQISAVEPVKGGFSLMKNFFVFNFFDTIVQPAGLAMLVMVLFASGAGASFFASRNSKPGDSLYVAKMFGERTRATLTFGETSKAKLGLEFASNRAKEISQILAEPKKSDEEKKVQVDKLVKNFQNEIKTVKVKMEKISPAVVVPVKVAVKASSTKKDVKVANNEDELFTAISGKEHDGTQLSDNPNKVIEDAEKLFDKKDYDGAADKLGQIDSLIDKVTAQGEMSETASTSK